MAATRIALLAALAAVPLFSTGCTISRVGGCGDSGCGLKIGCAGVECGEPACDAACGDAGCCDVAKSCYAGMKWKGSCGPCQGIKFCRCTGPGCKDKGCGPACGCEPGCVAAPACEPGCECDEPCGCGSTCGDANCECRLLFKLRCLVRGVFGCAGCDGELYWSEWHNDPPRCCDPCDKCGNWIGPSIGYQAPYSHPYAPSYSVAEGQLAPETLKR